jgi:hypothetical protein
VEGSGRGIVIGDIDGDGRPDLVVFHIDDFHTDHQRSPNQAFYRVGFQLGTDGSIARWGDCCRRHRHSDT